MIKVMIAGDSFGMPRPHKMNNEIEMHYEECYPERLRAMLAEFYKDEKIVMINYCKRANTSLGVLLDLKNPRFGEIYLSQPHYLVVQVGNVDCFERGRHHDEFAPFPELRGKNPWINKEKFIQFMAEIIKGAFLMVPVLKNVIIVNIPPIEKEDRKKNLATRKRIAEYNRSLKMFDTLNEVHVADIYKLFYQAKQNPLCSDGIHPNRFGSHLVAETLYEIIRKNS